MPFVLITLLLFLFGQPADGVSVSTDMAAYTQGDPVQVTIQNAGPDAITRGGIVCDDVWPLAVEQLQDDGTWQGVAVPRRASCVGIAGVLFQPGRTPREGCSQLSRESFDTDDLAQLVAGGTR